MEGFLRTRRWFGDKGREIRDVELVDRVPLRFPNTTKPFTVARVRVRTDAGVSWYQLFLRGDGDGTDLGDALEDPAFRRGLADAFAANAAFGGNGTRWVVRSESAQPLVVPPAAPVTLGSAEQSNSSVLVDAAAILKLYRKLEPGIHPDVEVTRFLTVERRFTHVPALLGTIRFEDDAGARVTVAGMLQELVPGAVDGWRYALDSSRGYFAGAGAPAATEAVPFTTESRHLGHVTRALHETLASGERGGDFDRRAATAADVRRWIEAATHTAVRALDALQRAVDDRRLARAASESEALLERRDRALSRLAELGRSIAGDSGASARTHGDYHLGQVLRSAAGDFLVIDFEGEPARPLEERRARHSPLRDVAGMLRSFAYAAAEGSRAHPTGASERAEAWERAVRAEFLAGYFAEDHRPGLIPATRAHADDLIALFEAEKAFYELQYELDHRPDWVWIPLRGLTQHVA